MFACVHGKKKNHYACQWASITNVSQHTLKQREDSSKKRDFKYNCYAFQSQWDCNVLEGASQSR